MTIEAADIFDLLNEELIKERYPLYPGHVAARAAAAMPGVQYKRYYVQEYGLDLLKDATLFEDIARASVSRGIQPSLSMYFETLSTVVIFSDHC